MIDLAVSELTFQHFADPLRALRNALELLKPGGHLLVNGVQIYLDPNNSKDTAHELGDFFARNAGDLLGREWFDNSEFKPMHTLAYSHLHIRKDESFPLGNFPAHKDWHGKLVYTHT